MAAGDFGPCRLCGKKDRQKGTLFLKAERLCVIICFGILCGGATALPEN